MFYAYARRTLVALSLAALFAPAAHAADITFAIKNSHPNAMRLELYSQDRDYVWPGDGKDFYLDDGEGGPPLGNIQLLGRVSGAVLKGDIPQVPEWVLEQISRHTIDFLAMSEDLPLAESRVRVDGERIILEWQRTNWDAHLRLVAKLKSVLRRAGFPLVVSRTFDRRTPSHQCGTVRMGRDPETAPLDPYCRAWDHKNLFVVDGSVLPSSLGVNPQQTVMAVATALAWKLAERRVL